MRTEDWPEIERLLGPAGWPSNNSRPLDPGAYLSLLRPFEAQSVADALRSLVGVAKHRPTASEIGEAITRRQSRRESELEQSVRAFERRIANGGGFGRFLSDELRRKVSADIKRTHGVSYSQLVEAVKALGNVAA